MIAPEASLLLSESIFTESVPLSSTIRDSSAHVDATTTNKAWIERGRLELIADQVCTMCKLYILVVEVKAYQQVHADQARLEKSTASLRRAKEIAALQNSSRLPPPPVGFVLWS